MKRRRFLAGGVVAICMIVAAIAVGLPALRNYADIYKCEHILRSLSLVVLLYHDDNHGQLPPDLPTLCKAEGVPLSLLQCPGAELHNLSEGDYLYIDWSARPGGWDLANGDYPLIYDRSLSNHQGRGICIAKINGSSIWDGGATWLKAFAAAHPKANIPIPSN
jgi:hypothetical protein